MIENTGGIPIAPLLDAVSRVPGVASATAATTMPFAFMSPGASRRVARDSAGSPEAAAEEASITPGFFSTLGVRLLAGRDFSAAESTRSRIAIINEALARELFAGQDAIGRRIFIGADGYDIIGIVIAIGMVLTTAGIYGVLAFAIARRSRELAVRVAIGATGRDLIPHVTMKVDPFRSL
jgi:ABC-type antimicrobial peptide transport system permease subunit